MITCPQCRRVTCLDDDSLPWGFRRADGAGIVSLVGYVRSARLNLWNITCCFCGHRFDYTTPFNGTDAFVIPAPTLRAPGWLELLSQTAAALLGSFAGTSLFYAGKAVCLWACR